MTTYDNEKNKICPDLSPAAQQEPQAYVLKKLTETETYLFDEIKFRKRLAKINSIQSQAWLTQAF